MRWPQTLPVNYLYLWWFSSLHDFYMHDPASYWCPSVCVQVLVITRWNMGTCHINQCNLRVIDFHLYENISKYVLCHVLIISKHRNETYFTNPLSCLSLESFPNPEYAFLFDTIFRSNLMLSLVKLHTLPTRQELCALSPHQSSASLAFVRGIHRWPVNSPHKLPVTRKMFPFDDVIMNDDDDGGFD